MTEAGGTSHYIQRIGAILYKICNNVKDLRLGEVCLHTLQEIVIQLCLGLSPRLVRLQNCSGRRTVLHHLPDGDIILFGAGHYIADLVRRECQRGVKIHLVAFYQSGSNEKRLPSHSWTVQYKAMLD